MLSINFNYGADVANNALQQANNNVTNDITHISTGLRILSAADDPAGLFIADQLHTLGTALGQGYLNTQQGYSLAQVADGQLSQIYNTLNTMYTYAVNAANSTNNINSSGALQNQITSLAQSIKQIVNTTQFNGKSLFNGSFINQAIQFGGSAGQSINISIGNLSIERMGAAIAQTGTFNNVNYGDTAANVMSYVSGSGPITVSNTSSLTSFGPNTSNSSNVITSDVLYDGNKQLFINGNEVVASAYASATNAYLDANIIANNINNVFNGQVSAQASNTLQGTQAFGTVQVASSATLSIVISRQVTQSTTTGVGFTPLTNASGQPEQLANGQYVGTVSQTINLVGGQTYSLQNIINDINNVATNTGVYATTDSTGQYLQLYTTDGSTFTLNFSVTNSSTNQATYGLNLAKFGAEPAAVDNLDGTASATYGAIVSVGSLQITSPSNLQIASFGDSANASDNLINNLVFNTAGSQSYVNGYSSTGSATVNGTATTGYNYFVKDLLDVNVTTIQGANQAQIILQNAINYVDTIRAQVGSVMQSMQTLSTGDQTAQTNELNAEANIRDLNVSQAMTQYQNDNTLLQSSIAMLAQANTVPQQLLTLFR